MNEIVRLRRAAPARPYVSRRTRRAPSNLRLWLPITPIAVVLSPLALLALPLAAMADALRKTTIAAAIVNFTRLALAMRGAEVVVRSRKGDVHIWIF
ncbi:MAG TPA: hypothetical protein VG983_11125 [Caulobacterales bacterium]|nr:hypothetical protein [Caulobacterales bacterium]